MATIELQGGQRVEVPDDATDEQIDEIVKRMGSGGAGPVERAATAAQDLYSRSRGAVMSFMDDPAAAVLGPSSAPPLPSWSQAAGNPARLAVDTMLPENIGTAAGLASTLLPMGRVASLAVPRGGVASKAANIGLEILMRAAGAAAPAYTLDTLSGQGDRAWADAATLAGGAGLGAVAGVTGRGVRQNVLPGAQAQADIARLSGAVGPQMGTAATATGSELGAAVFGLPSTRARQMMMDAADAGLEAAVPGAQAQLSAIRAAREDARFARKAGRTQGPEGSRELSEQGRAQEQALLSQVRTVNPDAADQYEAATRTFYQDLQKERFLKDAKLWGRDAQGATPNVRQMQAKLLTPTKEGARESWLERLQASGNQELIDAVSRGGTPMAQDVTRTLDIGGSFANIGSTKSSGRARILTGGIPLGGVTAYAGQSATGPVDVGLSTLIGAGGASALRSWGSPEVDNYMRNKRQEYDATGRTP